MSRAVKQAKKYFAKVQKLRTMGADGRAELKRMRDVTDSRDLNNTWPTAGQYHNPTGKQFVKGSSNKADRINRGLAAKSAQGRGI